jgi:hypothetical protein
MNFFEDLSNQVIGCAIMDAAFFPISLRVLCDLQGKNFLTIA